MATSVTGLLFMGMLAVVMVMEMEMVIMMAIMIIRCDDEDRQVIGRLTRFMMKVWDIWMVSRAQGSLECMGNVCG